MSELQKASNTLTALEEKKANILLDFKDTYDLDEEYYDCPDAIENGLLGGEIDLEWKDARDLDYTDSMVRYQQLLVRALTMLTQGDKKSLHNARCCCVHIRVHWALPSIYYSSLICMLILHPKSAAKWKAITYLLIDTGCRRGEIMGLKWNKVNFKTGVIVIDCALLYTHKRGVYEGPTKTGEVRAIKIAPQTLAVLQEWKKEYERLEELNGDRWANTPYVFVRDDGSAVHPDSITDWLGRFSKRHGLPHIHPHAFRHTAASTMIANGVDLVTTAYELGHANANTTAMIYAHQIAVARATAADVRAGVFANRK